MNVIIVVKQAIGEMNVENPEDQDQEIKEEEVILEVVQVVLKVKDIKRKENTLLAVEVKVIQKIKDQEEIEAKVRVDLRNLNRDHQDQIPAKVIIRMILSKRNLKVWKRCKLRI